MGLEAAGRDSFPGIQVPPGGTLSPGRPRPDATDAEHGGSTYRRRHPGSGAEHRGRNTVSQTPDRYILKQV